MTSTDRPRVHPIAILIVGILAVSTASIFIRFAQRDAPSLVVAAYRMTLAGMLLAPLALPGAFKDFRSLTVRQRWLVLLSGLFLALHFGAWITSLEYTSVASSVVLVTTTPLWVAILSPLVLKERMSRATWVGLILAMLGGALVGLQEACYWNTGRLVCLPLGDFIGGRAMIGNGLALFGAFMAAGYMLVGRQVRPVLSLFSYTFSVYSLSAIFLLIFVALSGQKLTGFPGTTYLWFVLLAAIPQVVGHSSFNWALKYLPAAFVSLALIGEPVGTTILAMIFLKEAPGAAELTGGALILFGIFLASRAGMKNNV
ncbi:MAG TPA: DMT family transporter [Bellilinea sp.]|nr:DMT family transporter [Bellilinea sp.]